MTIGQTLALAAAAGIVFGACGGGNESTNTPKNASDPAAATDKMACNAGHTDDKNHCSAAMMGDGGK